MENVGDAGFEEIVPGLEVFGGLAFLEESPRHQDLVESRGMVEIDDFWLHGRAWTGRIHGEIFVEISEKPIRLSG
jgi:hypothetical protein